MAGSYYSEEGDVPCELCLCPDPPTPEQMIQMQSSTPITFLVGPDKVLCQLPKDLLCHYSEHYKVVLNSAYFKKCKTNKIDLFDETTHDFQPFHDFLYDGKFWLKSPSHDPASNVVKCVDFLLYAHDYLGDVSRFVEEPLKKASKEAISWNKILQDDKFYGRRMLEDEFHVAESEIAVVCMYPKDSSLRQIVAQAVLVDMD